MNKVRKKIKKVLSLVLAVALMLGSVSINNNVKAETGNMSIVSVLNYGTTDYWKFNLNVKGTWPTNGGLDEYGSSVDKPAIIKNKNGEVLFEGSAGDVTFHKNDVYLLLSVWGYYTASNLPKEGDTVTIPAATLSYKADNTKKVNLTEDTILEYDGTTWNVLGDTSNIQYQKVKYTGINHATKYIDDSNCWHVYIKPNSELPGSANNTWFKDIKIEINGTERKVSQFFKAGHEGTTFFVIDKSWLPKEIPSDTTIVIKAGKYMSSDGSDGIEIEEDYTMYANKNGWTDTGFIKDVVYKQVSFTGLNHATGYSDGQGWLIYMNPTDTLPGTANVTTFNNVKVEIDGTTRETVIYKTEHESTGLIALDASMVPKKITKNTKVVIKAGKYNSNDGSDGLEVTKDYTIYMNQYGISDKAFSAPITYEKINFKSVNIATGFNGNEWIVYVNPDKTIPGTGDSTRFENMKVTVNGVQIQTTLYKSSHEGTACFTIDKSIVPGKITKDTKIVVKKGQLNSNDGSNGVEIASEFTIYANQYGFSEKGYCKAPNYKKVSFKSLNAGTTYFENIGWVMYLDPSATLPGKADSTVYVNAKVSINGVIISTNLYKSEFANAACIILDEKQLPKDIKKDTKIIVKAGKYMSNDGSDGVEITKDFTIYANQYGMSDDGFFKKPSYIKVNFSGIDEATAYLDNADLWGFYLKPTAKLPGKADSTFYTGIKATVDGKEINISINKAGYKDTAFIGISSADLPKNIKKNTKLVILPGKANSNDGSDGIEITKKFTIYINEWGMSTVGYRKKPNFKNITFKSIDSATGYTKESGWLLYLNPSTKLPGTGDKTRFSGLKAIINGKETKLDVYNAEYKNTALVVTGAENVTQNGKNKIVIKAGTALSNDGSDAIKLTKDFTVYANKYGVSTKGYVSKPKRIQSNAKVSLDRDLAFGGNKDGIYLLTNDKFSFDESWETKISSPAYETKSGIYYNGKKVNAPIVRHAKGKAYISLADAGIAAKDKDKVTINGVFLLNGKAVSYSSMTFYFNGKTWNTKYEKAKPETYTKFEAKKVDTVSGYHADQKAWHVYLETSAKLPGEGDKIYFNSLSVEVNGKKAETIMYHAGYRDSLFFVIEDKILPKNAPDGTKVTLKAGKALASDLSTGIQLTKDYTFYVYKGMLSTEQPTTNTKWSEVKALGLNHSTGFREDSKDWLLFLKLSDDLKADSGDFWMDLKVKLNGKELTLNVQQNEKNMLLVIIPESELPRNAKNATLTIEEGATAIAKAGHLGIKFRETYTCYMFNGMFSDKEYTEIQKSEARMMTLQTVINERDVYIKLNAEFPGTSWYERYQTTYTYNGKNYTTELCKADSSNNKTVYLRINETDAPEIKEGDVLTINKGTVLESGAYQITLTDDFSMRYTDGVWSQYIETDVKAPKQTQSLWEMARFDKAYIPTATKAENNSVLASNEDEFNTITSLEKMKDFTISFDAKKVYDDEVTPSFGIILRGNAISEEEPMTKSMLYGYVITFSSEEVKAEKEGDPSTWIQYIQLWKNGENYALLDQYRVHYTRNPNDHAYFQYEKNYNYTFSVYNITETCACIEVKVNDKLALRYYDEAGSDPMDPVVNEGTMQILVGCPTYFNDEVVELSSVISEADECEVGDEVRVSATYPSVVEGAEFTVDKEGATVEKGKFVAEKEGTYTVSCTYNGKQLEAKTIKVTKSEKATNVDSKDEGGVSVLPIVIGGIVVLLIGGAVVVLLLRKKKQNK